MLIRWFEVSPQHYNRRYDVLLTWLVVHKVRALEGGCGQTMGAPSTCFYHGWASCLSALSISSTAGGAMVSRPPGTNGRRTAPRNGVGTRARTVASCSLAWSLICGFVGQTPLLDHEPGERQTFLQEVGGDPKLEHFSFIMIKRLTTGSLHALPLTSVVAPTLLALP